MSIPLNNIVKINPGVLDVGNNGNNLFGLLLTQKGVIAANQITTFTSSDQIGKLFGYDSTEYNLANVYFAGFTDSDRVAAQLYMAPFYTTDSNASLLGGSLSYIKLEDLRKFGGDLKINIDGHDITVGKEAIDLSHVNSFSDAADYLTTLLRNLLAKTLNKAISDQETKVTVSFSSGTNSLIVTSPTTGVKSSVGFASGELANNLRLSRDQGAVQSVAVSNPSVVGLLNTLRKQNLSFCSVFLAWEVNDEQKMEFAKWAHSMRDDVCVILSDSNNNAYFPNKGLSFAEKVAAVGYEGVVSVYNNLELCAFIAGYPAAWDLTKTDGRFTAAFRRSSLLTANVTDEDQALALKANGYNFYGIWASATSNFTFMYEGRISGQYLWLDSWYCQVWMRRLFQYYFVLTLLAKGQIPYNTDGKGILTTAIKPAIDQFMNFGAIRTGIGLSDQQVQALKQAGLNQSQINNITSTGYYLKVDMARVTPQVRVQRGSPPISFWYTDGQSVQQINMNSIEIQ
ncbi:DUF3383 family protein [Commensalibacter oyaizuii]|uniref:DUF3383 family protein n=1 Tax=Commensalibacter oyaizuii TaxID=3043873 RepID=A0ABT6Q3K8_9PROT|nr:DUF3383 family protein [Commensalibacter sp. TBRC 16381]MDI2091682.1 DUF3383 family protein [Commensalibacter sp. TBRC 16381]